jgi:hypothetical protein
MAPLALRPLLPQLGPRASRMEWISATTAERLVISIARREVWLMSGRPNFTGMTARPDRSVDQGSGAEFRSATPVRTRPFPGSE